FLNQLVHLARLDMFAATNHAVFINIKLIFAGLKANQLAASFDAHAWKILAAAIAPFKYNILEAWVLFGCFGVRLKVTHFAANRPVETMLAHQDATAQIKAVTQRFLP